MAKYTPGFWFFLPVSAVLLIVFAILNGLQSVGVTIPPILFEIALPSGDVFPVEITLVFVFLAFVLYPIEAWKMTLINKDALLFELIASFVTFLVALGLFIAMPGFGNAVVFVIAISAGVDVVNSFVIGITGARMGIDMSRR